MLANNETGVIQPVAEAAAIVHAAGGSLHVDAVQGPGRIACDFKALGADLMTLSSHKIGGPQGVGALIKRDGLLARSADQGRRPGARRARRHRECGGHRRVWRRRRGASGRARAEEAARMAALRDRLEAGLKAVAPEAVIFGAEAARLPNTTLFSVPGMKAETAVIAFDLEGRGGVLGLGLFLGQGRALACSGRHGGGPGARTGRNPCKSRLCNLR